MSELYKVVMSFLPRVKKSKGEARKKLWAVWYPQYLRTDEWQNKRIEVIKRCKNICEECNFEKVDDIHHITYKNVGNEKLYELIGVCRACHAMLHGKKHVGMMPIAKILKQIESDKPNH